MKPPSPSASMGQAVLVVLCFAAGMPHAQEPQRFSLRDKKIAFLDAVKKLEESTGNPIMDDRPHKSNPELTVDLEQATFWQALDHLCKLAGCGNSPYRREGAVTLIEGTLSAGPTVYEGAFRLVVQQITTSRTFDTDRHAGRVHLEIAWEPRLLPFYLTPGPMTVTDAAATQQVAAGSAQAVAGRGAVVIDIPFSAPPRTVTHLQSLQGACTLKLPTHLLTVRFDQFGKPFQATQEGVAVAGSLTRDGNLTLVEIDIVNPPGWPFFESFQTWLSHNRLTLEKKGQAPVVAQVASDSMQGSRKANVVYEFGKDFPADAAGWSLVYRTPARIVEVTVPVRFRNIPLP